MYSAALVTICEYNVFLYCSSLLFSLGGSLNTCCCIYKLYTGGVSSLPLCVYRWLQVGARGARGGYRWRAGWTRCARSRSRAAYKADRGPVSSSPVIPDASRAARFSSPAHLRVTGSSGNTAGRVHRGEGSRVRPGLTCNQD